MSRPRPSLIVLAVVLALSGCSAGAAPDAGPTPAPTVPTVSPARNVTSAELVDAGLTRPMGAGGRDAELGVVPCATTAMDRYGTYTPVCLRDDAPALQFDPKGPFGWLVRPGSPGFDEEVVRAAVERTGRFVVEGAVDSTALWDDSPAAWEGFAVAVGRLFDEPPHDGRSGYDGSGNRDAWFDVGDWREAQGLRPAPYVDGVPRLTFDDLRVVGIYANSVDEVDEHGYVGFTVEIGGRYRELAVATDGRTWELSYWFSTRVLFDGTDGRAASTDASAGVTVGASVVDGMQALTPLSLPRRAPGGPVATVDDLSLSLPQGATEADASGNEARAWRTYTLGPGRELWIDGRTEFAEAGAGGGWTAVQGFDNYRLTVPGATDAAAEIGTDLYGRFRVRVDLSVDTAGGGHWPYHVEWDSTPERALDELRRIAGSITIGAGCSASPGTVACEPTRSDLTMR